MAAGTWQQAQFFFLSAVLCSRALPLPLSFGCGQEGLCPLSVLHCWHTKPQGLITVRWGQSWGHLSVSQQPMPGLASPLCHPPSNGHSTQQAPGKHARSSLHREQQGSSLGWLLAACPSTQGTAETGAASYFGKVLFGAPGV